MNTIVKEVELSFDQHNQRLMDASRYISSDGSGNYHCTLCEHKWRAYTRYLYWPIFLRWQPKGSHKSFAWHGWSIGYDGLEQKVFGWTLHIGSLKVCFGAVSRLPGITRYIYKSPRMAENIPQDEVLSATIISDIAQ